MPLQMRSGLFALLLLFCRGMYIYCTLFVTNSTRFTYFFFLFFQKQQSKCTRIAFTHTLNAKKQLTYELLSVECNSFPIPPSLALFLSIANIICCGWRCYRHKHKIKKRISLPLRQLQQINVQIDDEVNAYQNKTTLFIEKKFICINRIFIFADKK